MKTLKNILVALVLVFSLSFSMTSCGGHDDPKPVIPQPPTPTPQPTPNPGGGTGTCQGFTCKDFFIIGAVWQRTDTITNLQHGEIFTIKSNSDLSRDYYNGTVDVSAIGTYNISDCLKASFNVTGGDKYVLKFKDANTVYLVSQSVDYNSIDFSKQHAFYKRIK